MDLENEFHFDVLSVQILLHYQPIKNHFRYEFLNNYYRSKQFYHTWQSMI